MSQTCVARRTFLARTGIGDLSFRRAQDGNEHAIVIAMHSDGVAHAHDFSDGAKGAMCGAIGERLRVTVSDDDEVCEACYAALMAWVRKRT